MTEKDAQAEAERRWPDYQGFAYRWTNRYDVGYRTLDGDVIYSGATFEAAFSEADKAEVNA